MNKEAFSKIGILIVIIVVVIIVGGVVVWQYAGWRQGERAKEQREVVTEPKEEPAEEKMIGPWETLQSSLAAIDARDLETIDKLNYKPLSGEIDECISSGMKEDECWAFIGALTEESKKLKEGDFVNIVEDEKQIVMSTNPVFEEYPTARYYSKSYIYFIKDLGGNTLVLNIQLGRMWGHTTTATTLSIEEIDNELKKDMKDSDNDGLTDNDENCSGARANDPKCIKTNPNLKDTDGDGWWDSIELEAGTDPNNKDSYPLF